MNREVADILYQMAERLGQQAENRFKIIDYSKAAWTIEDLSDYLISAGHLKVLSLDYSISRIALKCGEEYRLLPGYALHSACCKAYGIEEMATNDSDFKRVSFLTL